MAISNNASSLRTGVCTSTTRPTAPYNGQVIYETDTGKTQVWNSSAWVMLTNSNTPPGLELVKTQTVGTSVASVTVSNVFNTTYDGYRITYYINQCSDIANFMMSLNNASGNTYYGVGVYWAWGGGTTLYGYGPSASTSFLVGTGYSGPTPQAGVIDIFNPNVATRTYGSYQGSGANNPITGQIMETSNSQHTGFTLAPATGTITGGTIRVYGYRNS